MDWKKLYAAYGRPLLAVMVNMLLALLLYAVARVEFLLENWSLFAQRLTWASALEMMHGALTFDLSALAYTHLIYIVLVFLPLALAEKHAWQQVCKWVFVVVNALTLAINLADSVYFPFTMRRTTMSFFSEFAGEDNLMGVFLKNLVGHWYLLLLWAALTWLLFNLYRYPRSGQGAVGGWRLAVSRVVMMLLCLVLSVGAMRGGFATAVRPIAISNANQYVDSPTDAALVLNTPFSLIRSIGKNAFALPDYFDSLEEAEAIYSPLHNKPPRHDFKAKNVVVFIIESFGREYIGGFNTDLEDGNYKGYTPFTDSLMQQSATWRWSFCNGRKSIDAMPSILSGIPMFVEPFVLTPAAMNHLSGMAERLRLKDYRTAFFHGAQNNSMGFQAFARSTGFQNYFGRTEFEADDRFGGHAEFDGTWAIWDEPFMQFFEAKLGEMQEPFMTALFTATSHNPFVIPEKYKDIYPEEGLPIHKCIRYTDHALERFFEEARKESWFEHTIFVILSDHTNQSDHAEYQTDLGGFSSPVIIYDPSGETEPGRREAVAQQIDVMPTVLGMLGYDLPYVAYGIDLMDTPAEETFAVNYLNGVYQYVKYGYVLQFDGSQTRAVYSLSDRLMQHNLKDRVAEQERMEQELKAIIYQYMYRMTNDRMMPEETTK